VPVQERDLRAFAKKAGYKIAGVWKETGSGAEDDRAEREKILVLAQAREIDLIDLRSAQGKLIFASELLNKKPSRP